MSRLAGVSSRHRVSLHSTIIFLIGGILTRPLSHRLGHFFFFFFTNILYNIFFKKSRRRTFYHFFYFFFPVFYIYYIIFFLKFQAWNLFIFSNWAVLQTPFTAFLRQTFPGSIKTPVVIWPLLPFAHPILKRKLRRDGVPREPFIVISKPIFQGFSQLFYIYFIIFFLKNQIKKSTKYS